jgi:hypothetical protein
MRLKNALGITVMALALAIIITPQFLNCSAQGHAMTLANGKTAPMKCLWSARAEIAVGIPILASGAAMLFARKKESLRYLGILGSILGIFVILIPTTLIGVCNSTMVCNTVMRPSLILLGSLTTAISLAQIILSSRKEDVNIHAGL